MTIRERLAVALAELDRQPTRESTISWYGGRGSGIARAINIVSCTLAMTDEFPFKDECLRALKAEAEQLQREAEDAFANMEELR